MIEKNYIHLMNKDHFKQACRLLNWIGGTDVEVKLRTRSVICYIFASIGQNVFAKIVLFYRHGVEKWGSGGLPPETFSEATPSRILEILFFQSKV